MCSAVSQINEEDKTSLAIFI
uniref:Uncharacterized protein n=1 Tax=Arundo donax TaxID=35708 RepID=A0A0A9GDY3_ARUDO